MSELTQAEIQALQEALDDEYQAWTTYDQVIADFGYVRPFSNIREAEARHIDALIGLFRHYGLSVPENSWRGRVQRYSSLQAACEAGVQAEIANGEMYDRLIRATSRADILAVLRKLQAASQERHLPAFQRCVQRHRENHAEGDAEEGSGGRRHRHRGGRCRE